jgi:hypothetical protein
MITASIIVALMMEAVNVSEISVSFYQVTGSSMPEESHFITIATRT